MLKERGVDVVLIQETKRRTLEVTLIKSIWPFDKMDYMGVDADGRAGGLLCIWHPDRFKVVDCCGSRNFIILSSISGQSFECSMVNVYAPNDVGKRRQLWESLKNLKISYPNPWCMGGDFNEIRFLSERKGCSRRDRGMNDFNELIDQLNLVDLPMKGRRFTWCNAQDGKRWSRIDRLLLEMKSSWEVQLQLGWAGFRLMRKLASLKVSLRRWNVEVFGHVEAELKNAEEDLHVLDLVAEERALSETEANSRREVRGLVWNLHRRKESLWHQKSRMLWAKCGDKNTRFFFSI
ncbi:uncharacterized protein LOC114266465 [Camellia sinensis]|uniref:uncharacterized protein LOC114266465 n=1 Tax=Camellia sinensis TaxID=4442 RepID=UPI0010363621|nr:uncharacterized protein LOC114266465 [Camellia sinensis]